MKFQKMLLGLVAILFAAVSAYASASSVRLQQVWYQSNQFTCASGFVDVACTGSQIPCEKQILSSTGNPAGLPFTAIFADDGDGQECADPYLQPE